MDAGVAGRIKGSWLLAAALVVLASSLVSVAPAAAAAPELLWQAPGEVIDSGGGAGEFDSPQGLDVDPASGNVYVADYANHRIVELDPWGQFVQAWGWGVRDGSAEAQTCTTQTGCQKGIPGAGPGQLVSPIDVAVDDTGNVYVLESEGEELTIGKRDIRVQKFTSSGEFLLMFGGEVNKTTGEDVCTKAQVEGGDECGAGTVGPGPAEFAARVGGPRLAIGPSGNVFVGDDERIEEFEPNGTYVGEVTGGALAGNEIFAMAMDSAGNFYAAFTGGFQTEPDVHQLDPSGSEIDSFAAENPRAVTIGEEGQVYILSRPGEVPGRESRITAYDSAGKKLIPDPEEEAAEVNFGESLDLGLAGIATSSACGIEGEDLYVTGFENFSDNLSAVFGFGPPPDPQLCPPPVLPPTITDQFPIAVGAEEATVKAKINPHFWPDTTFYVEYGIGKCSEGGCALLTPEQVLSDKVVNLLLTTKGIDLSGLVPATTYHFRFVAESGGGGPVKGVEGSEGTFTTDVAPGPTEADTCPNAQLRTGFAALLQDCRGYEMVSPVDKLGGDIFNLPNVNSNPAAFDQAAVDGSRFSYSAYRAFEGAVSSPYTSQYLATRTQGGWSSDPISPPRGLSVLSANGLDVQYRLFSPDLCQGWLLHDSDPPLAPGAVEGFANLYGRTNCGASPTFQAFTTTAPPCTFAGAYVPDLQGISADGEHLVFRAQDKLTPTAGNCVPGANNIYQCYESFNGALRLISALPSGVPSSGHCSIGTSTGLPMRFDRVQGAISNDGQRVYWTGSGGETSGPGTIYIRINSTSAQSKIVAGECSEPARACTLEVGQGRFWAASPDGSKALFITTGGDLNEYDLATRTATQVAGEVLGLMGTSTDASKVYLVSREVLDSGAQSGLPNLYLHEAGGSFTYIATLAAADVELKGNERSIPSPVNPAPFVHTARVTPDGVHLVFMSTASLTGAVNTDAGSGQPDAEVFLYDAAAEHVVCASCATTGVRPTGRELRPQSSLSGGNPSGIWAASQIPGDPSDLYSSRPLSENGRRLFFQSFQPLVPRDTNGKQDLYQWESPGEGTCTESSHAYRPPNGGCISLISSGEDPQDVEFVDASSDGSDVFFTTTSSLVAQDTGLLDVYDARIEGGFRPPPSPPLPCKGESCQAPAPGPTDGSPASASPGAGNGKYVKKPCPKGKVRRHGKCVKKHKKGGKHKRAHRNRGG